jgi:hypothetical protein
MGWRFRRSIKFLPGIRLNLSRSGVSASVGVRGAHITVGNGKVRTTVGLPGSGLSYTHVDKTHAEGHGEAQPQPVADMLPKGKAWHGWLWILLLVAIAGSYVFAVSGCATALQPGAETVRVATAAQKERLCEAIKIISVEQRVGPNKPRNAMNKALNEVAAVGGNGIFVISTSTDWAEGASVTAEALKCRW